MHRCTWCTHAQCCFSSSAARFCVILTPAGSSRNGTHDPSSLIVHIFKHIFAGNHKIYIFKYSSNQLNRFNCYLVITIITDVQKKILEDIFTVST